MSFYGSTIKNGMRLCDKLLPAFNYLVHYRKQLISKQRNFMQSGGVLQ